MLTGLVFLKTVTKSRSILYIFDSSSGAIDPKQPSGLGPEAFVEPGAPLVQDALSNASQIIDSVTKSEIQPHVGYMKELGLDFGWGPTAFLQWSLENVHVYLETPWWATLAITTFAIRLVLFGLHTGAADNAGRMATIQPHLKDIKKRLDEAKETRNMADMMRGGEEMRQVYAVAGVKMWKNLLPFVQIPLAFGMFRLTKNMASLPLPGLDIGGVLWFQDLTVSDPYFLLPILTGTAAFAMFKLSRATGGASGLPGWVLPIFQWVLPIISSLVMCFWPAVMQIGFAWSAILTLFQTYVFTLPWFRRLLRIHPMPRRPSPVSQHRTGAMTIPTTARTRSQGPEAPAQGLLAGATSRFKKLVAENQPQPSGGRTKAQIAEAKKYEEKRTREIKRDKQLAEQERLRKRSEKKGY
ncbi:MAG: hypothetical protein Q9210_003324 [Variospora velana]